MCPDASVRSASTPVTPSLEREMWRYYTHGTLVAQLRDMERRKDQGRIVVVDDDEAMCELLLDTLTSLGYEVSTHTDPNRALAVIESADCDAVITDVQLGTATGLHLCSAVQERCPEVPVIVITAFGSVDTAVGAIRAGAYDFLNKPVEMRALDLAVTRAVSHRRLQRELHVLREASKVSSVEIEGFVGESEPMKNLFDMLSRLEDSDASVLVRGESGTGKELVARALHSQSDQYADGPFIAVNCAAVPANLLESTLFGHVKGAFTDAKQHREGLFSAADGGTLFLDEISEMALEMQSKLLRVLQERKVRPVGGSREIHFDCRIVAATNTDLEEEIAAGRFREDLYYRINVVTIPVPPLRARGNDVLLLAQHFLEDVAQRTDKGVRGISQPAARKLLDYDWPGNVRELRNAMERAVALTQRDEIVLDDLPPAVVRHEKRVVDGPEADIGSMLTIEELERKHIQRVLRVAEGNKTRAAKVLGIDRRTLYRKLERFDMSA